MTTVHDASRVSVNVNVSRHFPSFFFSSCLFFNLNKIHGILCQNSLRHFTQGYLEDANKSEGIAIWDSKLGGEAFFSMQILIQDCLDQHKEVIYMLCRLQKSIVRDDLLFRCMDDIHLDAKYLRIICLLLEPNRQNLSSICLSNRIIHNLKMAKRRIHTITNSVKSVCG